VIHEAVPSSANVPEVYQINYVSGYNGQSFASPRDAFDELADTVFSESVQNPAIDLKTKVHEKEVSEPLPATSYPKASTDHVDFKATEPVASRNEFFDNQHHNIAAPLETFVEASDANSDTNFSNHKVKTSADNEQSVAEKEEETSNRKQIPYTEHVKEVQDFISEKFESPKAEKVYLSDDTVKNHKKRKIDVNDYYKSKESIETKPIRNIDFVTVPSANILPTIYRSQIKFIPESKSNGNQERFDIQENKSNKSVETNVNNLSIADSNIGNKNNHLDKAHFQPKIFKDSTSSVHTEKPDSQKEETTINSENERHHEPNSSSLNIYTNLNNNKQVIIVANKEDLQEKELYQTIFEEYPPVTTRRPKYKIIRKARIPKQLTPHSTVYHPVHRSGSIKLVYKDEGFVPEYVPRY